MRYTKLFLIYVIVPALFYPAYFIISNAADSFNGIGTFLYWIEFESNSLLIKVFLNDWLTSLPIMYGIFYLLILPVSLFFGKSSFNSIWTTMFVCIVVTVILSYMVGFQGAEFVIHGFSIILFVGLYFISSKTFKQYNHANLSTLTENTRTPKTNSITR